MQSNVTYKDADFLVHRNRNKAVTFCNTGPSVSQFFSNRTQAAGSISTEIHGRMRDFDLLFWITEIHHFARV
jgi:hypothetical protein